MTCVLVNGLIRVCVCVGLTKCSLTNVSSCSVFQYKFWISAYILS